MRRVLMISYYFPPQGGIGSVRALKLATYLPVFGWEPVVVAPRQGSYYADPSLSLTGIPVHWTRNLQLGRVVRKAVRSGTNSSDTLGGSSANRIRALLRRWVYRPDGQIGWYPFAVSAGRGAIREGRFDAIFSSSFPVTAHLVGRRLHRDTGIPWVAEFRDLWTDWGGVSQRRRRLDQTMERSIIAEAAEIVTVSPAYAAALHARGARHASVMTNGFDPSDFVECKRQNGITAGYLGQYYPDRQDLDTALHALGRLAREGMLPNLHLRFIGNLHSDLNLSIRRSGVANFLECTGIVPHKEALRYLHESSLLLLAGPTTVDTPLLRGNIPGKTFEYLGSGRPVLFIGHPESDVAQILRPFPNVRIVAPRDVDAATAAVLLLLRVRDVPSPGLLERFTSRFMANSLAEVLNRVCR